MSRCSLKNSPNFIGTCCNHVVGTLFVNRHSNDEPMLASFYLPLWLLYGRDYYFARWLAVLALGQRNWLSFNRGNQPSLLCFKIHERPHLGLAGLVCAVTMLGSAASCEGVCTITRAHRARACRRLSRRRPCCALGQAGRGHLVSRRLSRALVHVLTSAAPHRYAVTMCCHCATPRCKAPSRCGYHVCPLSP